MRPQRKLAPHTISLLAKQASTTMGVIFRTMTQHTHQHARIAVEPTIHVAEERHHAYINATKHAHIQEIESVRRNAHNALAEQANRYAWETHVAATAAVVTTEATTADVARSSRLRELELALELQGNESARLQRERASASQSVLAHALTWAASKSDSSSRGAPNANDIPSGGSPAHQSAGQP